MNNGIIKCCSFNNNLGRYATLFYSNETASFLYNNAVNNSQYTLIYRSDWNNLQMIQSNFSHTKSHLQGSLSSSGVYFHEQKFINNYKCGNDSAGASIEIYLGKSDISFSNYIDIESNAVYFIVIGYGSESIIRKCLFQIKGFQNLVGLYAPQYNETIKFEDCTIISEINYKEQYITAKNVIIDSLKNDYTFVKIPQIESKIINFDESMTQCKQANFWLFFLFIIL